MFRVWVRAGPFKCYVTHIVAKAGKRVYKRYKLKRAGIGQHDIVTIYSLYVSIIRPVLEYACPVWHANLNTNRNP